MSGKLQRSWCVRLLRYAGVVAAGAVTAALILHTAPVRAVVLHWTEQAVSNATGLSLHAQTLRYDLSRGWLEVGEVAAEIPHSPTLLTAKRLLIQVPFQDLIRGDLHNGRIAAEEVRLQVDRSPGGRWNWPQGTGVSRTITASKTPAPVQYFRSLQIRHLAIVYADRINGLSVELPAGDLECQYENSHFVVTYGNVTTGHVQAGTFVQPLDRVTLKAMVKSDALTLSGLRIATGHSSIEVGEARLAFSRSEITATGTVEVDARQFFDGTSGKGKLNISISGSMSDPAADVRLTSNGISVGDFAFEQLALDGRYSGRKFSITEAHARALGTRLSLRGVLDHSRPQLSTRASLAVDGIRVDKLLSGSEWKRSHTSDGRVVLDFACNGTNWKQGTVSGAVRLSPVDEIAFRARMEREQLALTIESHGPGTLGTRGTTRIRLADKAVSGVLYGRVESVRQTGALLSKALSNGLVDGSIDWTVELEGKLSSPRASFSAESRSLQTPLSKATALSIAGSYDNSGIHADRVWITSPDGSGIYASGSMSSGRDLQFSGVLKNVALHQVVNDTAAAGVVSGIAFGEFTVRGTAARPHVVMRLSASDLQIQGQQFGTLNATASMQDSVVDIQQLHVKQPGGGTLEGSASVNADGRSFRFAAAGTRLLFDNPALRGIVSLTAEGEGSFDAPKLRLVAHATDIASPMISVGRLDSRLEYAGTRGLLFIEAPDLNASLKGQVDFEGDYPAELTANLSGTQALVSAFSGSKASAFLEGLLTASGSLRRRELLASAVRIRTMKLDIDGHTISAAGPVNVDYQKGILHVSPMVLNTDSAQLRVSGSLPARADSPAGVLSIAGTLPLKDALKVEGMAADGELRINAAIVGSLANWVPKVEASLRSGRLAGAMLPFSIEQLTADAHVTDGVLEIENVRGMLGGGDLRGSASLPLRLIAPEIAPSGANGNDSIRWTLEAAAADMRFGTSDPASGIRISVRTTGEARSFALRDIVGSADLSAISLYGKGGELKQSRPSRILFGDSVLRLEETELRGPNAFLLVSGTSTLTDDPNVQLRISGEIDASALSIPDRRIDAGGRVKLDVSASGNWRNPAGNGSVEVTGGSLAIRGVPMKAEDVTGRLEFAGNRIVLNHLTGRLNGGKFSAQGEGSIRGGTLTAVEARTQAENVFLDYPTGLRTSSRLNLALRSEGDRLVLGGKIEIRDGIYREVFDPRVNSAESSIGSTIAGTGSLDTSPIGFDLQIVTTQPLEMDNNIGRIAATGNLRLRGTSSNPAVTGDVRLEEGGRIYFGDRTYEVERGNIRFDGTRGLNPQHISLVATTRTSDYDVRLNLAGDLTKLTTTFTSDPPLSRNDIISVLVTGKTISENRGVDISRLEASLLLSGAFNATLGGSMGRKLGVSQVSVQPGVITAESDPATRLTITEDFTRSLRLIYSMNLSDSSDQIWIMEYDLSRKLRSRAVKESDNSYRAEVRHEVRFGPAGGSAMKESKSRRTIGQISFQGGSPFSESELARQLGLKTGQNYSPVKVRAGVERLLRFLRKKNYLEARVVMDREEQDNSFRLIVTVDSGAPVGIQFTGDSVSGGLQKRIRDTWQTGHNDRHRIEVARQLVTGHYGREGFLKAALACDVNISDIGRQVTFKLSRGRRYSDVDFVISGASHDHVVGIRSLIGKGKLQEALYADPPRVSEAVARYYRRVGYLAADVGMPEPLIDEKAGTAKIVMAITEGPAFHIGRLRFEGNQALKQDVLASGLPLKEGGPFEPARLTAAVTELRTRYESQGYRDVQVEYRLTQEAAKGLLDVTFSIQEKDQRMVESVSVQGTRQTSEAFVRKQLQVAEGQPESVGKVNESIQNLSRTGAFASVDIESRVSTTSGFPDRTGSRLLVVVQEPKPFRVLYGPLYNTNSGFGFIADIENRNSLGNARVLGLRTRYDGDLKEIRLYLTQPVWQRRLLTSTATTYVKWENIAQGIRKDTIGVSVQQDWPFHSKYLLSYGYRYERVGLTVLPGDPRIVPLNTAVIAPAFFTGSRDTRDSFLDATRGSFIATGSEFAPGWLGSDYGYLRWSGQYFRYFPLRKPRPVPYGDTPLRSRLVFATGARIGLQKGVTEENIVLTDRFFAGGGTTIRGFAQDMAGPQTPGGKPLGGNAMLVLNNELRFPMFWIFDAVAFNDIGNVFPNVSDFTLSNLRKSAGFGLRLRNPFVVLRFDYGIKLDRRPGESFGAFFFSIGQAF